MTQTQHIHNLVILDESGSMESIKDLIISGFNELVQNIRGHEENFPGQKHSISLFTFNTMGTREHLFREPVSKLGPVDASSYRPAAMTPLFDAMGAAITKLRDSLNGESEYRVLVTILTDGLENASVEYNSYSIRKMMEKLKISGWTFTYIGADHNVEEIAMSISIRNTLLFEKSTSGVMGMMMKENEARKNYYSNLKNKEIKDGDFYKEDDEDKKK